MKLYELYFIEENKYTQLLKAGKLSKPAMRSIQKYRPGPDKLYVKQLLKKGENELAQKYLAKKGIVKSARDWLAGVNRGAENVYNKNNVKVVKDLDKPFSSYVGGGKKPNSVEVHLPKTITKRQYQTNVLIKKHEADEVIGKVNQSKKYKYDIDDTKNLSTVGNHMSDEVLRRERELIRTTKGLHNKPAEIEKYRKNSGEYENLGTKKEIKKIDKTRLIIKKEIEDIENKIKILMNKKHDHQPKLHKMLANNHKRMTKTVENLKNKNSDYQNTKEFKEFEKKFFDINDKIGDWWDKVDKKYDNMIKYLWKKDDLLRAKL